MSELVTRGRTPSDTRRWALSAASPARHPDAHPWAIELKLDQGLTLDDFRRQLLHPTNSAVDERKLAAAPDVFSHPLSHYWISCSHNSYLVGDQLTSRASADMYRRALTMGVRCVEIDIFDSPDGGLEVYHKFSATTRVPFRSVLEATREAASSRPVRGPPPSRPGAAP